MVILILFGDIYASDLILGYWGMDVREVLCIELPGIEVTLVFSCACNWLLSGQRAYWYCMGRG